MFIDPESHAYKYNPVDPLTFTIVEDVTASVVNAYFQRERLVDILPRSVRQFIGPPMRDQDIARQLQKVVNLLLLDPDTELLEEFTDFVKQGAIFGTTYSSNTPRFDRLEDGSLRYLGPKIKTRSFFHTIKDPQATRMSEARYVFEIEPGVSFEELKKREKQERYFNVEMVKNDDWLGDDRQDEIFIELGKLSRHHSLDTKSGKISLIHMYLGKHIITIAAGRVIVRDTRKTINIGEGESIELEPYPYFILDEFKWVPVPKEGYGMGIGASVAKIQEINSIFQRLRLQNIELVINKVILADLGFDTIDIDMLVSAPGNIWDVPPGSIEVLKMEDITRSSWTEQQLNTTKAENAAGNPGISQGQRPPRRTQATTEVQLNQNAAKKGNLVINRINYWWKQQIKKTILQMHSYMEQWEYERILGEQDAGFYLLPIEDIDRLYDINITTTALEGIRDAELATMVQALQEVQKFGNLINMNEILKDVLRAMFPYRDTDRYLLPPPPPVIGNQPTNEQVPGQGAPPQTGLNTLTPQQVVSNNTL